jgi:hypothetical protein
MDDLPSLLADAADRVSLRKLHLFACACCRQMDLDRVEYSDALDVAEQLADGVFAAQPLLPERLAEVTKRLRAVYPQRQPSAWFAVTLALADLARLAPHAVRNHVLNVANDSSPAHGPRTAQVALPRDIVGNPFQFVTVHLEWLLWQDRLVPRLARSLYDERRFTDLPIVADALEDAGCDDPTLLGHLRAPGLHVRGCWAVDQIAGMW